MSITDRMPAIRRRTFEIIEIDAQDDAVSRAYDFLGLFAIAINLLSSILFTFTEYRAAFGGVLLTIEAVTVAFFAIDYVLRLMTAKC